MHVDPGGSGELKAPRKRVTRSEFRKAKPLRLENVPVWILATRNSFPIPYALNSIDFSASASRMKSRMVRK